LVVVFLALELAPVLVKLFASYDTYDSYLQRLENIAIIDNLLVEIDAHLRYDLWVKLREIRAKFLEDQMSFLLGDSKLNEDTRRVVGNRASNEFRDTASSALRDKQPVISYMKPRSQGGRELVVILRERLKEGKDRIAGTFRRLGEFLKTSLSAMEILRWLGIKIGE
jgi:hypothetical protein